MAEQQIDVRLYFDRFILSRPFLSGLQALLLDSTPALAELEVEEERVSLSQRHMLHDCIEKTVRRPKSDFYQELSRRIKVSVPERLASTIRIRSRDGSLAILIHLDEFIFIRVAESWYWGNSVLFRIMRPKGSSPLSHWAREIFETACRTLSPAYAHAVHVGEYDKKNMCFDSGVEAIGVDWGRCIPGLYWLNYFGKPFSRVFGTSKILDSLKDEAARIGRDGLQVSLGDDPYSWDTEQYKSKERKALEHLGRQYFFDRAHPERKTVLVDEIALMIESSPAGPFDPSKPSVLRVWVDELPDEHSEGDAS